MFAGIGSAAAAEPAVAPNISANNEPVRLPPFVVSALRTDGHPWRYAKVDCFEVLTRADDVDTGSIVAALQAGKALEDQVIPAEWLGDAPTPYLVIVDDASPDDVERSRVRTPPIEFDRPRDPIAWHGFAGTTRLTNHNFGAGDRDTFAINRNVYGPSRGHLYATITVERLARSTPPLPIWLSTGLLGPKSGVFREGFAFVANAPGLIGAGLIWMSPKETERLVDVIKADARRKRSTKIPLLPLAELFVETPPTAEDKRALWESEAALLVHWALFGPGAKGEGRAALVDFVERTRRAPASEALFVACFGRSYAAMQEELATYLVRQLPNVTPVTLAAPLPSIDFNAPLATSDQIGRILGDWLRMRAAYVADKDPLANYQLLRAAGRALERTYREDNGLPPDTDPTPAESRSPPPPRNAGRVVKLSALIVSADRIHDPLLLAVYGLFEHQIGEDGQARPLLEKAVKAHVPRPEAFRVLAHLRYEEALTQPAGAGGKLSRGQTRAVLDPLEVRLRENPGSEAYALLLDTWEHSEALPTPADLVFVQEAANHFPRNLLLVYRAARLCAVAGYADGARAICEQGLLFATDERRDAFTTLEASLRTVAEQR